MRHAPPDAALFAAALAGDRLAADVLLRRLAPTVLGWCTRLGGPRVDAEDAAQESLVRVFRGLGRVAGPDALVPWAFGVTRRVLADHRRRAWVRRWLPGEGADTVDARTPERQAGLSEAARRVRDALETLPAAQREAFVLCVVEDLDDETAAHVTGVPVGTLKSRLRLARARLADLVPEGP